MIQPFKLLTSFFLRQVSADKTAQRLDLEVNTAEKSFYYLLVHSDHPCIIQLTETLQCFDIQYLRQRKQIPN